MFFDEPRGTGLGPGPGYQKNQWSLRSKKLQVLLVDDVPPVPNRSLYCTVDSDFLHYSDIKDTLDQQPKVRLYDNGKLD